MPQIFEPSDVLIIKLVLLVPLILILLGVVNLFRYATSPVAADVAVEQPIPFSHKHHVGDDGIDCRYCHTSVEEGPTAGMPSTSTCLTCHAQLFRDAPALAPLHDSLRDETPIRWKRVHQLPDFVYFDHSIHINKGVSCQHCHGRVDQMPAIMRQQKLDMQWCLQCHENAASHVGPPDQVFAMHDREPLSKAEQKQLVEHLQLQSTERLTSCSTCHR
ncbi:MAG TPA: cytochrome c3 family protein [Burkholderiaceae bacterium]|nr:cytochrome c3 family protein [Burkholderiaceae bacterium]